MKVPKIENAARRLGRDAGAGTASKFSGPNRQCLSNTLIKETGSVSSGPA